MLGGKNIGSMVCTELSKFRGVESSNQATIPLIHQILLAKTGPSRRIGQLQSAKMPTCPWTKRLCEDAGCLEYGWPGGLRSFLDRWGSWSETPSSHTCRIERSGSAVFLCLLQSSQPWLVLAESGQRMTVIYCNVRTAPEVLLYRCLCIFLKYYCVLFPNWSRFFPRSYSHNKNN